MEDMMIQNHLAIASEAFVQVMAVLARILTASALVALAITIVCIVRMCFDESRKKSLAKAEGKLSPAPSRVARLPITLAARPQSEKMALSIRHRRA